MNRHSKLFHLRRLKKTRDELLNESNEGRQRKLLFKLDIVSITTRGNYASCELYGGWTFSSDEGMQRLSKIVCAFRANQFIEGKV